MDETDYIAALVELHQGLACKGPGDSNFSLGILANLSLPLSPRIADLGCGSGASALLLAQHLQSPVVAVDSCLAFIEELQCRAQNLGLPHLVRAIHGDIAHLDLSLGEFDLLW